MSDNTISTGGPMPESSETNQIAKPKTNWPWWKTIILIAIGLATVGLFINSIVQFEITSKHSKLIQWPEPPAYTGETPLAIDNPQEAWNSYNNLVLIIIPCGNATLNDSITTIVVEAANKIRSTDKIYVGVFILPQDDSLSYPSLRLRLYTESASAYPITMYENITKNRINNEYLDRRYLRN